MEHRLTPHFDAIRRLPKAVAADTWQVPGKRALPVDGEGLGQPMDRRGVGTPSGAALLKEVPHAAA